VQGTCVQCQLIFPVYSRSSSHPNINSVLTIIKTPRTAYDPTLDVSLHASPISGGQRTDPSVHLFTQHRRVPGERLVVQSDALQIITSKQHRIGVSAEASSDALVPFASPHHDLPCEQ
jgi:hypothetical protein